MNNKNYFVKDGVLKEGDCMWFKTPNEAWRAYLSSLKQLQSQKQDERDKLIDEIYEINNSIKLAQREIVKLNQ